MLKRSVRFFIITAVAVFVFSAGLSWAEDTAAFQEKVKKVTVLLDEVRDMKARNEAGWKAKDYKVYAMLWPIFAEDRTSAEVYLLFARCFWYNDRLDKATSSLRKASYYAPLNIDILIFTGDMYSGEIKKHRVGFQDWDGNEEDSSIEQHKALRAYEAALKVEGINAATKGSVYLRLGDMYELVRESGRAKKSWQKAIDIAPGSDAAEAAASRLKGRG